MIEVLIINNFIEIFFEDVEYKNINIILKEIR